MNSIEKEKYLENIRRINIYSILVLTFCVATLILSYTVGHTVLPEIVRMEYVSVHTILEFIAIIPAFAVFTLGLATARTVQAKHILILSFTSLAVGILDIAHVLSFKGMAEFITPAGPNKAIYFWFSSRLAATVALLYTGIFLLKKGRNETPDTERVCCGVILALTYVGVSSYFILFEPETLPRMFNEGVGLTDLKVVIEGAIGIVSLITSIILMIAHFRNKNDGASGTPWLSFSCFIFALSGICFLSYSNVDDRFNFLGHVFKIIAMAYVYYAIFIECVKNPLLRMQELARKAEYAEKTKTQFLANVSHELRTPLGIISGYTEMLEQKNLKSEASEWIKIVRQNSNQLKFLIDDLLDIVKIDDPDFKLTYSQFSLDEFLKDCESDFKYEFEKKHLNFNIINRAHQNLFVVTDKYRLRQIFNNILSNARKFTDKGFVRIEVFEENQNVVVRVVDSGKGIEKSYQEHLFKPFNQLHDLEKGNLGGTGLGLSLSQKLAQLLGGDLYLEDTTPGGGSSFVFSFKNASLEKINKVARNNESSNTFLPRDFGNKKVLIADDVKENLNLLKLYLMPWDLKVEMVDSGIEALERVESETFDLILLDIQMPIKDGYTTAKEMREKGINTPIVAVSAHVHDNEKLKAFEVGFQDYLFKPIEKVKLQECLVKYL